MMRKLFALLILVLPMKLMAADVANGAWSDFHQIQQMNSYWSYVSFKMDSPAGCGGLGSQWWKLNMHNTNADTAKALEYKRAVLLTAYMTGKQVSLRCEGGAVTDFIVK